jgi:hypothetical protein
VRGVTTTVGGGQGIEEVAMADAAWSRRGVSRSTLVVTAVLLLVTAATVVLVRANVAEREDQTLRERAADAAVLLSTTAGEVRSALGVLASVADSAPTTEQFEAAGAPLIVNTVRVVALVDDRDGELAVVASVGEELAPDAASTSDRAELVREAQGADGVVSAVLRVDGELRIGYALQAPSGRHVVLRETGIDPTASVQSLRGQVLSGIDVAVYAGDHVDPDQLILTTTQDLPLAGDVVERAVPIGASQWLIVTAAQSSLVDGTTEATPWIVLVAGAMLTLIAGAFVESLARRRS